MLVPLLSIQAQNTGTQRSAEIRTEARWYPGIYYAVVSTLALKYSSTEQEAGRFSLGSELRLAPNSMFVLTSITIS